MTSRPKVKEHTSNYTDGMDNVDISEAVFNFLLPSPRELCGPPLEIVTTMIKRSWTMDECKERLVQTAELRKLVEVYKKFTQECDKYMYINKTIRGIMIRYHTRISVGMGTQNYIAVHSANALLPMVKSIFSKLKGVGAIMDGRVHAQDFAMTDMLTNLEMLHCIPIYSVVFPYTNSTSPPMLDLIDATCFMVTAKPRINISTFMCIMRPIVSSG